MAIRIVNEMPDKSVLKRAICKKCGVAIEYAPIDVKTGSFGCFDDFETLRWVDCPKCKAQIAVR